MTDTFDAKAEAGKIAQLAKDTLDYAYRNGILEATASEDSLAKELASVWGDPAKAVPVAGELAKITHEWSSRPNFGLHLENTDGQGWNLGNHMIIDAAYTPSGRRGHIEVDREGNQLKVSIAEGAWPPQSITTVAELPDKQK